MAIDRLTRLCYLSLNCNRNHKGYIYCDLNNIEYICALRGNWHQTEYFE